MVSDIDLDVLAGDWTPPDDPEGGAEEWSPRPSDAELLVRYTPQRIAVVDRESLYICRPDTGAWLPLERSRTLAVRGTLLSLIRQCRAAAGYDDGRRITGHEVQECLSDLSLLVVEPQSGVLRKRHDDFDSAPILPLLDGGGINLMNGDIIPVWDLPPFFITAVGDGIAYNPEVLRVPAPAAVAVEKHYGRHLLRRFARHLLGPDKTIDTVRMPLTLSGKSTLADAMMAALPGQVTVTDAAAAFGKQGIRWSDALIRLAENRIVIFDEADKITEPPPHSSVNALTARTLRIEAKMMMPYTAKRRGNAVLLGADWPAIELGQGADSRFRWAHDAYLMELPAGLADWMLSEDGRCWLATWLIDAAIDIALNGDDTEMSESISAALGMLDMNEDPLLTVLGGICEPGEATDWVSICSVKERLAQSGSSGSLNSRVISSALSNIAPQSTSRKRRVNGRVVAGRQGLRLVASEAESVADGESMAARPQ